MTYFIHLTLLRSCVWRSHNHLAARDTQIWEVHIGRMRDQNDFIRYASIALEETKRFGSLQQI